MKKIAIIILTLIILTGCGKKNNIDEVYDVAYELYQIGEKEFRSKSCSDVQLYQYKDEVVDYYNTCMTTLDKIETKVKELDKLMKKCSNEDLVEKWDEMKEKPSEIIPKLKEAAKIYASLSSGNKNISSLPKEELNDIAENHNGRTQVKYIAEKVGIDWAQSDMNLFTLSRSEMGVFDFYDNVGIECRKDDEIKCSCE